MQEERRDSVLYLAERAGIDLGDEQADGLLRQVKEVAIAKKSPLTEGEFLSLARQAATG